MSFQNIHARINATINAGTHLDLANWTPSELERRDAVLQGKFVVASFRQDAYLLAWAKEGGLLVRVDRANKRLGNPYALGKDGTRAEVVSNYRKLFETSSGMQYAARALTGKVLACWCYPESCHGDVIANYLNAGGLA